MSIEGRIESLKAKHAHLHAKIEALEAERAPDKYVQMLKKEKLLIKDELTKLEEKIVE